MRSNDKASLSKATISIGLGCRRSLTVPPHPQRKFGLVWLRVPAGFA